MWIKTIVRLKFQETQKQTYRKIVYNLQHSSNTKHIITLFYPPYFITGKISKDLELWDLSPLEVMWIWVKEPFLRC